MKRPYVIIRFLEYTPVIIANLPTMLTVQGIDMQAHIQAHIYIFIIILPCMKIRNTVI